MSAVPSKVDAAVAATKLAQIGALIKDNQLLTAAIVFIAWQAGAIASASSLIGGMC